MLVHPQPSWSLPFSALVSALINNLPLISFFLAGPSFATSVLKFIISDAEEVILAVPHVTGVVTWSLLPLRDLTPQKTHNSPI